jgi:arylsulfatase A
MTGLSNVRNYINFGTLDTRSVTFANLLKAKGYSTCITGKWQLGQGLDLPKNFGFDEYCLWQHTRRPPRYANPGLEINGVEKNFNRGEYGPDLVNDYALDFIKRQQGKPFLLYYPMMLTHSPYQPTPDSKDWDPKAMGEQVHQKPEHFGDMVTYMDKLIGKLVSQLETLGLREETLILFLGDNGTGRGTRSLMGERVVMGGKGSTTISGMHVPLIASWPGKIAAGKVCSDLVDTTDFLPTLLEATGTAAPPEHKFDGQSFFPQLRGEVGKPRSWLYAWYSPRQSNDKDVAEFAYDHRFKLYRNGEFYHLVNDPAEKQPLAVSSLEGEAAAAAIRLQAALDQFKDARPAELEPSSKRPEIRKSKKKANSAIQP